MLSGYTVHVIIGGVYVERWHARQPTSLCRCTSYRSSRPNEFKIDFVHSMWLLIGCRMLIGHSSGVGIRFICVELNAILITGSFWAGYCCAFRISSADNLEEIAFAHK